MGSRSKQQAASPMLALVHRGLLALQAVFWLVALGGIAQLMQSCRLAPGATSTTFALCSAEFSWSFWVIFFHAIAMATALATITLPPGSKPQASASAIALRFYLISTVQWCTFAYNANNDNAQLWGVNTPRARTLSQGHSAALAGAVVILIANFTFLIIHDVPIAHAATEAWGGHGRDEQNDIEGGKAGGGGGGSNNADAAGAKAPPALPAASAGEAPGRDAPPAGAPQTTSGFEGFVASVAGLFRSAPAVPSGPYYSPGTASAQPGIHAQLAAAEVSGRPGPPGPDDPAEVEQGSLRSVAKEMGWYSPVEGGKADQQAAVHSPAHLDVRATYNYEDQQQQQQQQQQGGATGVPAAIHTGQVEPVLDPALIREDRVATAVSFLNHPRIKGQYAAAAKRRFLQDAGRGLTPAEVEEALRRAGGDS